MVQNWFQRKQKVFASLEDEKHSAQEFFFLSVYNVVFAIEWTGLVETCMLVTRPPKVDTCPE